MNRIRPKSVLASVLITVSLASQAFALDVGSDGLSGVLNPAVSTQIDLSLATTGDLADPGRVNGTFDPVRWAVIFKYSSVTIPSGSTVTFKNHPSGAPVVWLVQGNVTIASGGFLSLQGSAQNTSLQICPGGPGGFAGAAGLANTAGTGPGGGDATKGGSYATNGVSVTGRTYGNPGILPLVGGSGGGAVPPFSGGGGGGAILIAANGTMTLNGNNCIAANGTSLNTGGGGSGGAVRLLATTVTGSGSIIANGGTTISGFFGGLGRIRIEANTISILPGATPTYSTVAPLTGSELLFPDASAPTVRVSAVNGQAVSPTPNGELNAIADITLSTVLPITVDLVSLNVPVGSTVTLRVVPISGSPASYSATSTGSNTWQVASVVLPSSGVAQMQAKAVLP